MSRERSQSVIYLVNQSVKRTLNINRLASTCQRHSLRLAQYRIGHERDITYFYDRTALEILDISILLFSTNTIKICVYCASTGKSEIRGCYYPTRQTDVLLCYHPITCRMTLNCNVTLTVQALEIRRYRLFQEWHGLATSIRKNMQTQ